MTKCVVSLLLHFVAAATFFFVATFCWCYYIFRCYYILSVLQHFSVLLYFVGATTFYRCYYICRCCFICRHCYFFGVTTSESGTVYNIIRISDETARTNSMNVLYLLCFCSLYGSSCISFYVLFVLDYTHYKKNHA